MIRSTGQLKNCALRLSSANDNLHRLALVTPEILEFLNYINCGCTNVFLGEPLVPLASRYQSSNGEFGNETGRS